MKKVAMIGALGQSPAVMTELARYLIPDGLTDVIMLPTREDEVVAGARLVEAALKVHHPRLRVHIHFLPFSDVLSEEDNLTLMEAIARAICRERFDYNVDEIYLNAAGGRKVATVSMALMGALFGITAVYHVIHRDIKRYNILQEQLMDVIMKFKDAVDMDERVELYERHREDLDELLYPSGEGLSFIRIPVVPYDVEEINLLKRILRAPGVLLDEEWIPEYRLKPYVKAGLIECDERRVRPTDLGVRIGRMLRCEF